MKQPDLFQPSDPYRLHRVHAAPASGAGGVSFDLGGYRWRPDGGPRAQPALARAIAYRIAFTWNAAEGIPLPSLEAGYLADFHEAALQLAQRVQASAPAGELIDLARRLTDLHQAVAFDLTDGRLSDCAECEQLEAHKEGDSSDSVHPQHTEAP